MSSESEQEYKYTAYEVPVAWLKDFLEVAQHETRPRILGQSLIDRVDFIPELGFYVVVVKRMFEWRYKINLDDWLKMREELKE